MPSPQPKPKDRRALAVEAFLLREGHTGVERYILNLIRTLAMSTTLPVTLFTMSSSAFRISGDNPNLTIKRFPLKGRLPRIIFQHFIFPFWLKGFEKVFFTGYVGSLLYPAGKSALAVFDLIALQQASPANFATRLYYRACLPWFLRRASLLVVPSEKVRGETLRYSPRGAVLRLPIPVDEAFYGTSGDFSLPPGMKKSVLVVGFGEKKKNQHLLRTIAPRLPDCEFILVGRRQAAEDFPENVRVKGFIPQDELVRLYHEAHVLALLSWDEGYGLPVVEALVSGTPALCWKTAPFTEIRSPLLHFPESPDLDSYIRKLGELLRRPRRGKGPAFRLIRWSEYWARIESKLAGTGL